MLAYGLEYCDIDLRISDVQIQQFLHELEERKFLFSIEKSENEITVGIKDGDFEAVLLFRKLGESYKLRSKQIHISDEELADLFQHTLTTSKGHAVVKMVGPDFLLIHNIQFGEPVRITEIHGEKQKVLLDRDGSVTIEQVIEAFKSRWVEERIPALRKELDEELARFTLLLSEGREEELKAAKERLNELRKEMLLLEA